MLGIIQFNKCTGRDETKRQMIDDNEFYCVSLRKKNSRKIRKAAKLVYGMRVVIPDDCDSDEFKSAGICAISARELPFRMAVAIYKDAICRFNIPISEVSLTVRAGYLGVVGIGLLSQLAHNARYISIQASDAEGMEEYLLENFGISSADRLCKINITLFMYENNFSLHIIMDKKVYVFRDVTIRLPAKFTEISQGCTKGLATALLQAGTIDETDVEITNCIYAEKLT